MQASLKTALFANLVGDVTGGIMTTIVAIPVAMAFGIASGLGAAAGLYGAMCCGLFASIFGGTKGQQSGPTGPVAVIIASLLAANNGNVSVVFAAIILGGILQAVAGRFGWGDLVRYLPYPVISGFMTGIALIIIILHVKPLFGIPGSKHIMENINTFPSISAEMNRAAFAIGVMTIVFIYGMKLLSKKLPASLIALFVASTVSIVLNLEIPRIGEIPSQLPVPAVPTLDLSMLSVVLSGAVTIAMLGSIDSLLTSLIADKILHSQHDSNKELIGQGIGNIAAGLMGGLAGAGSTTRTLANIDAGGRTPLAGVVYAALVFSVITGLGKVAALIPMSALAAILIVLGIGIVDWRSIKHIHKTPRSDVAVMSVVLFMTVFIDLISAVLIGMALASVLFVKKITDAQFSEFGTLDTISELGHLVDKLPTDLRSETYVYTFDGPIFFGETKNLDKTRNVDKAKIFILNFEHAHFIDQSCCYYLEDLVQSFRKDGKLVLILGLNDKLKTRLNGMECFAVTSEEFQVVRWTSVIEKIRASTTAAATST
ncbi:MAG: SulP family inorganic anion transporter [Candidatus Obscuribacterales bacterium]|nr:SulP family inorganic anion transporter [Candidatus Obscuribacterales bacterium]